MTEQTPLALIQLARTWLERHASPSPRVDAEVLLAHVLGVERIQLYALHDRPLDEAEVTRFRELLRRRAEGTPVAYLTGTRGFWTVDIGVAPGVLIPRPETELLVEHGLRWIGARRDAPWAIADVGTGSGALAIAFGSEVPGARVVGIDASAEALAIARQNVESAALGERVRIVEGDLLAPLLERGRRAHLIVSNPPYVGEQERDSLSPEVRDHEPAMALFAGADGLDVIRRLLPQVPGALRPGGCFLMEFGATQGEAVRALAAPHFASVDIVSDYGGHPRMLVALVGGSLEFDEENGGRDAAGAGQQADEDGFAGREADRRQGADEDRAAGQPAEGANGPGAGARRSGGLVSAAPSDESEEEAKGLAEVDLRSL